MTAPRDVLRTIRDELQQVFLERNELIDGALVALVAAQHVLVIGPPGTAKSMLADEICRRIAGAQYFQWLLTRFTTPEELFGAVSLKALEQDDVPLLTLFAASNELPEDDELLALHDRFLLRFVVDYVSEDFRFLKLLQARPPATRTTLSLAELQVTRAEAEALAVPASVLRAITDIRRELGRKNIVASDRRYAQAVGVLRARAYLAGRDAVSDEDLPFLEHVLWRDPAEHPQVRDTIRELLRGYEDEVRVLLFQSRELRDYALREWDSSELRTRAAVEAHTKIRNILGKVDAILAQARSGGRPVERVEALKHEIVQIQREMLARL